MKPSPRQNRLPPPAAGLLLLENIPRTMPGIEGPEQARQKGCQLGSVPEHHDQTLLGAWLPGETSSCPGEQHGRESDPTAEVPRQEQPRQGQAGDCSMFGLGSEAGGRQEQGLPAEVRSALTVST